MTIVEDIRELKVKKEMFITILKDILEWEENIYVNRTQPEDYKIRKLISELPPEKLKITFLKLEEAVFFVVVRYESINGEISTSWIHEDEVFRERILFQQQKHHPSHSTPCLTDLYEIAVPVISNPIQLNVA